MVDAVGWPVKIIQRVAAGKFQDFGMYLLNDENMTEYDVLQRYHIHEGPEGITEAIIKKWLVSKLLPHTWEHLIGCIRMCGLGALAEDIENALSGIAQLAMSHEMVYFLLWLLGLPTASYSS